ncbi:MAG: thiamine monophosphate synthase [Edaphobacter sp.]|nr:thiamine monophosphate synthase [Edaphobacter sp.]
MPALPLARLHRTADTFLLPKFETVRPATTLIVVIRYAITSRALFPGTEVEQQAALLRQAALWAANGIDIIQLREKDLPTTQLAILSRNILHALQGTHTQLLINTRFDVAMATSAHGVHLSSSPGELIPIQLRHLYSKARLRQPLITVSCHSIAEVERIRIQHPDAILFAPVFEKSIAGRTILPGVGLDRLREACAAAAPIPVYALGGVTLENTQACLEAGASGIAGIRLFHNPDV